MTVNQLLQKCLELQQQNLGEAKVIVNFGKNELANGREATTVTVEKLIYLPERQEFSDLELEYHYVYCGYRFEIVDVVNICGSFQCY